MRTNLWPLLAISFLVTVGNAQDDAAPESPGYYGIQGNAAATKAQHDAEMQRALQEARQTKALKESMAAYAPTQQRYLTPEQFLNGNRPPSSTTRSESDGATSGPVRRPAEVPVFDQPVHSSRPQAPRSAGGNPNTRKAGWFDLFKSRKSGGEGAGSVENPYTLDEPPPPASSYPAPENIPVPGTASVEDMTNREAAIAVATQGGGDGRPGSGRPESVSEAGVVKPALFRLWFGKGNDETSPAEAPSSVVPGVGPPLPPPASATDGVGNGFESTGIPTPPSFEPSVAMSAVPPEPVTEGPSRASDTSGSAETGSSIFVSRSSNSAIGEVARVKAESKANVEGVLVRLYEGTEVSVLSRSGGEATIRLPDQRVGTIKASALSR